MTPQQPADLTFFPKLLAKMKPRIPLILNGDIYIPPLPRFGQEVGYMIARGAQKNPSVFATMLDPSHRKYLKEPRDQFTVCREYMLLAVKTDQPWQNAKYCIQTMWHDKDIFAKAKIVEAAGSPKADNTAVAQSKDVDKQKNNTGVMVEDVAHSSDKDTEADKVREGRSNGADTAKLSPTDMLVNSTFGSVDAHAAPGRETLPEATQEYTIGQKRPYVPDYPDKPKRAKKDKSNLVMRRQMIAKARSLRELW